RALPVADTVRFFADLVVDLREEAGGKLFPVTNRAKDVLDALLSGVRESDVDLRTGTRVHAVARHDDVFMLTTSAGDIQARKVVLATGGSSLPKTGSDGGGYAIAQSLGHTIVAPTPALVPLLLDPASPGGIHPRLSGVAVDGAITIWIDGAVATRLAGALLWTHFGLSGPLALNASRHWARAALEERS